MPLSDNVLPGRRRTVRGLLRRVLAPAEKRHADEPEPAAGHVRPRVAPAGVEAMARTYWARGQMAPATAVQVPAEERSRSGERVRALVHAHERGLDAFGSRPRGNPAFSEALFVELMRARQYRRAFEHLSAECRQRWGSADAFAAAQGNAVRRLQGVRVKEVRYLPEWTDPDAGRRYREVAELDVEYTLAGGSAETVLPRVVHLVPDQGKWRSLCYPD